MGDIEHLIGLTGPFGSGCTTAAKYLEKKSGFKAVGLSNHLREKWSSEHPSQQPRRRDLQSLGDQLRADEGNDTLIRRALAGINDKHVVVDGIRNVGEISYLRNTYGYHFTLLGIIPTFDARWDRLGANLYSDDKKGMKAFFADDERDQDEDTPHGQQVRKCIDQADILIDNSEDVTLGEYKRKVLNYAELALGFEQRPPYREEIMMNVAYSMCHSSRCLKRHVGAIVVDSSGEAMGFGFNENPKGMRPCKEEHGCCFKDKQKAEHLKQIVDDFGALFCPLCGIRVALTDAGKADCQECKKRGITKSVEDILFRERGMTWCTAIHAEAWALSNAGERARGGELFTTTYPCLQCAEKIVHAGIKTVWYTEPYPDPLSGNRLALADIELRQFEGVRCFDRMFANTRPN